MRSGSTCTESGVRGRSMCSRCPRDVSMGCTVSIAASTIPANGTVLRSSHSRPWVILEISSRSSSNNAICRVCRPITSRHHARSPLEIDSDSRMTAAFNNGASGLRSSCASIARNRSFCLSDALSDSSSTLRSVMSMANPVITLKLPCASRCSCPRAPSQRTLPSGPSTRYSRA